MTTANTILSTYPEASKVVVVLSGGMDSTIAARLAVEKYGAHNVHALSFFYKQKQSIELDLAKANASKLGLASHILVDISFLGDMVRGISANVEGGLAMPTIKDILGVPTPASYVPNRNMIMLSIATSYAETVDAQLVITGLQAQDEYSYFDTTQRFVDAINAVLSQMRQRKVQVFAPFISLNKSDEIKELLSWDGSVDLLAGTITCYNPNEAGESCGACPSCAERIMAFMRAGIQDPIPYAINIPWMR